MKAARPWAAADWLVAALIAVVLLLRLGGAPLYDVDEGAFSEATREMLASGDFGSTTLNGAPRFDKPILVYWLQAASAAVLGISETAFRLPSALCSIVWCAALWAFARPRLGAATSRLAALMLACSLGVLAIGRAATADALLNMLLALAMFEVWRVLERGPGEEPDRAAIRRAYLWVGLGLLAKGPVAALIPGAVSLLAALATGRFKRWREAALHLPGWAILVAVAAPWYAYILDRHGMAFVDGFILKHNVSRYTSPLEGHSGSLLYYLVMGPLLWLPWSGLLPAVLGRVRADWQIPLGRYLWVWAGFVIVFFSLSGTKLPHYLLYGSTPVFIGLAQAVKLLQRPGLLPRLWQGLAQLATGAMLLLILLLPPLLQRTANKVKDPLYAELLGHAQALVLPHYAVVIGAVLGAWLLGSLGARQVNGERSFAASWTAGGVAFALLVVGWTAPWLGSVLQGPLPRAAAAARAHLEDNPTDGAVVQWKLAQPSFSVYLQAVTPRGEPQPGQLALTRRDRLDADPCDDCRILFEDRGFVLLKKEVTH